MSIFQELDFDDAELIDPCIFFHELSNELHKPLSRIIVPFLRNYEKGKQINANIKLFFYDYDEINGFDIIPYDYDYRCSYILTKIAQGAHVVSGFSEDEGNIWKLKDPENYGILDSEDQYTDWCPFYFKLSNLEEFLAYYSIPITPYIANKQKEKEELNNRYHKDRTTKENNDYKNSNLIKIPVYESLEATAQDLGEEQNIVSKVEISNQLSAIKQDTSELGSRERNNLYALIGGLLFLLLSDKKNNRNQSGVIHQLEDLFSFSRRTLEQRFPQAKQVLLDKGFNFEEKLKEFLNQGNIKDI